MAKACATTSWMIYKRTLDPNLDMKSGCIITRASVRARTCMSDPISKYKTCKETSCRPTSRRYAKLNIEPACPGKDEGDIAIPSGFPILPIPDRELECMNAHLLESRVGYRTSFVEGSRASATGLISFPIDSCTMIWESEIGI